MRTRFGRRSGPWRKRNKDFFFEKKKQKTFDYFGCGLSGWAQPRLAKVFWFFFSKKNRFLTF
jgi:hypothetical protein